MVPPGKLEVTPSASGSGFIDGRSEYLGESYAVQALFGVAERVDVGATYVRLADDDGPFHALAFGPRVGVVENRVAFAVPFSFLFGEDILASETWAAHPTALFTLPLGDEIDFNPSVRAVVPIGEGDLLLGFNAGFGFRVHPVVTIRPEVGVLISPGEDGVIWTFGVGLSMRSR